MSTASIFLIAIIALITIVILFYALEQCAKYLESRNHRGNKLKLRQSNRKRSRFYRNRQVDKMATILEQHEMFNLVAADSEDEDEGGEDQEDESALDTDFGTLRHECLAIVMRNGARVVGINLFRKDLNIEYFWEKMPECCCKHASRNEEELEIRALLATIHHWSTKWVYADPVHLLCSNEPIVRQFNQNHPKMVAAGYGSKASAAQNGSLIHWIRQVESLSERYDYTLLLECAENYVCELADAELWDDLIHLAKTIIQEDSHQRLNHLKWPLKQVHLTSEDWHQIPHLGDVS